jgi:hypothetical protein
VRTFGLVAFSTGWMIPFAWSVVATHWFINNVVWQQVVHLVWPDTVAPHPIDPIYGFFLAHYAFGFSMVWLFAVIVFWIVRYVRATTPVEKPE